MQTILSSLTTLTTALLKATWQASAVILLVLLVQWLGRKHLSPRVRYALWLLVVLRLALPISLESSVSVFHQARSAATVLARAAKPAPSSAADRSRAPSTANAAAPTKSAVVSAPAAATGQPASVLARQPVATAPRSVEAAPPHSMVAPSSMFGGWPWPLILSLVWLAGVVFLLGRIIWVPLRLSARLARHETATLPAVFEILEQAKRLIGVNQVLPIVQSRAVQSPALLGFIRPWLLLPQGLVEKFSPDELRLVFLHELAHLKRRDIAVNWLTTLLQILHWFNPLVWYAFARMRADREEACDELALAHARAEENRVYGHAIIKLLEGFSRPPALPGLVGILEDKQHMQRRIAMIAQFKRMIPWSAPAAGLFLVLGIVTLTDAQTGQTAATARIFGPSSGPAVKILVSGTTFDARGVLSPDETAVAYADWPTGPGGDLVVRDLRTGAARIVAASSREKDTMEFPWTPVWSSDSRSIAYLWWDNQGSDASVRVVSREGGAPRVLGKRAEFFLFDWSRDGKHLLGTLWGERLWELLPETKNTGASRLAVLAVDSDTFQIIGRGRGVDHARFSPDGKFIVYESTVEGKRNVFVSGADGSNPTPVGAGPLEQGSPIFSADGRFVLFGSNQRGSWDLWAIPFAGGRIAGASFPIRYDFGDHPKWITATGKLVFKVAGGVERAIGGDERDIYEVSATQSPSGAEALPRRISRAASGRNFLANWSRDGNKLAYIRPRATGFFPKLCIHSDGKEQEWDPRMVFINGMFWSPDGQTIAMAGCGDEPDAEAGLYFFSLATHTRASAHLSGRQFGPTNWLGYSADGKEFYYYDRAAVKRVAVTIATSATREIPLPEEFTNLRGVLRKRAPESWDESSVVYVKAPTGAEQELVVADSNWKNPRVIARVKAPAAIELARLSPDRTKIAYIAWPGGAADSELHVKAIDGTWERIIDTAGKRPRGFSWSGDGSRLAVGLDEKLPAEIGVLENFLPAEKLAQK